MVNVIPRYSRERMSAVWSPENRYRKWLDIEVLACEAMARHGSIPLKSLQNIKKNSDRGHRCAACGPQSKSFGL